MKSDSSFRLFIIFFIIICFWIVVISAGHMYINSFEISLPRYKQIEKLKGFSPLVDSTIKKSIADNIITGKEFNEIMEAKKQSSLNRVLKNLKKQKK